MGLNAAIQAKVESMQIEDPLTKKIHIKMSGCPNSCGQHHIANIGFHGAAMKVGSQQLPAYHVFVGGAYDGGDDAHRHPAQVAAARKAGAGGGGALRLPVRKRPRAGRRVQRFLRPCWHRSRSRQPIQDLTLPGEFIDDNRSCSSTGPASSSISSSRRRRVRDLGSARSQNKEAPQVGAFLRPR